MPGAISAQLVSNVPGPVVAQPVGGMPRLVNGAYAGERLPVAATPLKQQPFVADLARMMSGNLFGASASMKASSALHLLNAALPEAVDRGEVQSALNSAMRHAPESVRDLLRLDEHVGGHLREPQKSHYRTEMRAVILARICDAVIEAAAKPGDPAGHIMTALQTLSATKAKLLGQAWQTYRAELQLTRARDVISGQLSAEKPTLVGANLRPPPSGRDQALNYLLNGEGAVGDITSVDSRTWDRLKAADFLPTLFGYMGIDDPDRQRDISGRLQLLNARFATFVASTTPAPPEPRQPKVKPFDEAAAKRRLAASLAAVVPSSGISKKSSRENATQIVDEIFAQLQDKDPVTKMAVIREIRAGITSQSKLMIELLSMRPSTVVGSEDINEKWKKRQAENAGRLLKLATRSDNDRRGHMEALLREVSGGGSAPRAPAAAAARAPQSASSTAPRTQAPMADAGRSAVSPEAGGGRDLSRSRAETALQQPRSDDEWMPDNDAYSVVSSIPVAPLAPPTPRETDSQMLFSPDRASFQFGDPTNDHQPWAVPRSRMSSVSSTSSVWTSSSDEETHDASRHQEHWREASRRSMESGVDAGVDPLVFFHQLGMFGRPALQQSPRDVTDLSDSE